MLFPCHVLPAPPTSALTPPDPSARHLTAYCLVPLCLTLPPLHRSSLPALRTPLISNPPPPSSLATLSAILAHRAHSHPPLPSPGLPRSTPPPPAPPPQLRRIGAGTDVERVSAACDPRSPNPTSLPLLEDASSPSPPVPPVPICRNRNASLVPALCPSMNARLSPLSLIRVTCSRMERHSLAIVWRTKPSLPVHTPSYSVGSPFPRAPNS